jgi:hypothetical protein
MAKHPVTFFIRIADFHLQLEDICLENAETNENLSLKRWCGAFVFSRFPRSANGAKWIQANEKEISEFGCFFTKTQTGDSFVIH